MDKSKISKTILIILSICLVISALASVTYALFSNDTYAPNPDVYSTGTLSIEAHSKSDTISLTNALPMTDEDGMNTTPYIFTIKNTGNLDYKFDVKLLSNSSNMFSSQYIMVQINNDIVTNLSSLADGKILSDVILYAGEYKDVSVRIWLNIDTPNSELGKNFEGNIIIDGQAIYTASTNMLMGVSEDPTASDLFLRSNLKREEISSITFVEHNTVPNTAITSVDVSYSTDGTVIMWYGEANNNGLYDIYI